MAFTAGGDPHVQPQVVDDPGDLETAVDPAAERMKLDRRDVWGSRDNCTELVNQPRVECTRDPDCHVVLMGDVRNCLERRNETPECGTHSNCSIQLCSPHLRSAIGSPLHRLHRQTSRQLCEMS